MVGGDAEAVEPLEPIFTSLAPPGGYLHVGGPGAGHYVKMVHNGIEYGLMQAYAEGFEILHASDYELDLAGDLGPVDAGLGRPLVAARAGGAGVQGERRRTSSTSRASSPTPARAAGRSRRRSTTTSRRRSSRSRC